METHFTAYVLATVRHIVEQLVVAFDSYEAVLDEFPFLGDYATALEHYGLMDMPDDAALGEWFAKLLQWESQMTFHLPLRALRDVGGLDNTALLLLLSIGLIEEDPRFGHLYASVQDVPGQHRSTVALLQAWWRAPEDCREVRAALRGLHTLGLVRPINPDAPRLEHALEVPPLLWDALRGEPPVVRWAEYRAADELPHLDGLIIPEDLRQQLAMLPGLLATGEVRTLIVRGLEHNGRRTLLRALARELGRGILEINRVNGSDDNLPLIGPLATLLNALPVLVLDPAPGETVEIPILQGYTGPLGIVCGSHGGLDGIAVERALTFTLPLPDLLARRQLWQRADVTICADDLDEIATHWRITSGNIMRAAGLAVSYAALARRTVIKPADVQQATRALNRQALDSLAEHVTADNDWSHLVIGGATLHELTALLRRCRHRERLSTAVGTALSDQLNSGVRALLAGPSGTGKTLAARALAAELGMDLYRVDLAMVVNKYIGETEKNLSKLFAHAEELDVILLLDEGDALLTRRTAVQSSNDRYANLETNYLLQRIESYDGILLVTTNAAERIDGAFQRRMDVVVNFKPPDAEERWTIWQLHLPGQHRIDALVFEEIVARCALTGGQIRNAALHAALLALDEGNLVTSSQLVAAVQREYRKLGALCPLRPLASNRRELP